MGVSCLSLLPERSLQLMVHRGGLTIGGLAAVFYGTQMLSGIYRNQYDFYNTAYGGMAAGAMLGAACEWHFLCVQCAPIRPVDLL